MELEFRVGPWPLHYEVPNSTYETLYSLSTTFKLFSFKLFSFKLGFGLNPKPRELGVRIE